MAAKKKTLQPSKSGKVIKSIKEYSDEQIVDLGRPNEKTTIKIFNPYDKNSYQGEDTLDSKFEELKPVEVIKDRLIRSDGLFDDQYNTPTTDAIYIYQINWDIAVLRLGVDPYTFTGQNRRKNDYKAFAFYDKAICPYDDPEQWKENADNKRVNEPRTMYQMWHFGAINREDVDSKKDWIKIPREIFSDTQDYVYLAVCTDAQQGAPKLEAIRFPQDRYFFYDLPVATSVYHGQHLNDSRILLGLVMSYEPLRANLRLKQASPETGFKPCKMEYHWVNGEKTVTVENEQQVFEKKTMTSTDYYLTYKHAVFEGTDIDLYIYKKSPDERKKDLTAFVWQSGNEDDAVKKEYLMPIFKRIPGAQLLKPSVLPHPYNAYSYIMDCLSSHTMYSSMVSLTKFTSENAARYAVRTLAHQPEGNRCFSVDGNNLVFLIGGALFMVDFILTGAYSENRALEEAEYELIQALYAINGNHLFYDSAVNYDSNTFPEAQYYLEQVLGIKNRQNGCIAISKLLTDLFAEIANYGVKLDYVYSDIEWLWNDARTLVSRRFTDRYIGSYPEAELNKLHENVIGMRENASKRLKFYDRVVIGDVMKRDGIWAEMLRRGFKLSEKTIDAISVAQDVPDKRYSLYGIQDGEKSYEIRRAPNIWDAVMRGYVNEVFYQYVIRPIRASHPDAKCSVFSQDLAKGYTNHAKRFETYLGGTVYLNPDVYSCGAAYGEPPEEYYKKLCMDNWRMFPNKRTFYSHFVGNINQIRRLLVSSQSAEHKNGKFNAFIGSFNMWVNDYLNNDDLVEQVKDLKSLRNDQKFLNKLEQYYKEFLYHTFLCCPDRVNAYFEVERSAIRKQKTTDNGGTYYFPFGDVDNLISYKKYFQDSYYRLQKVLEELNTIIGGNECETVVTNLATGNDQCVISGVKFSNIILWRITAKDYLGADCVSGDMLRKRDLILLRRGELIIKVSDTRSIIYRNGRIYRPLPRERKTANETMSAQLQKLISDNIMQEVKEIPKTCGLWVVTPVGIVPKLKSSSNYYELNSAYCKKSSHPRGLIGEVEDNVTNLESKMRDFIEKDMTDYIEGKASQAFYTALEASKQSGKELSEKEQDELMESKRQAEKKAVLEEIMAKKLNVREWYFGNDPDCLKLTGYDTNTVFGKSPDVHTSSIIFKVNKEPTTFIRMLSFTNLVEFIFGARPNKGIKTEPLSVSIWGKENKEQRLPSLLNKGKTLLKVGSRYELLCYIFLDSCVYDETVNANYRYEVWTLTEEGIRDKLINVFTHKVETSNPYRTGFFSPYWEVLYRNRQNEELFDWDTITIEEYKIYNTQQHEKLELFRERDGVNIGRINKDVDAYRDMPVETKRSDTLVGKLSWLNATDRDVEYELVYSMNGVKQQLSTSTHKVGPNSEGSIIIPLPALKNDTTVVRLECRKAEIHEKDLNKEGKSPAFFLDYYNQHRVKSVEVKIVP